MKLLGQMVALPSLLIHPSFEVRSIMMSFAVEKTEIQRGLLPVQGHAVGGGAGLGTQAV